MAKPSKELISKHLMLLFNKGAKMKKKKLGNFKTSHGEYPKVCVNLQTDVR